MENKDKYFHEMDWPKEKNLFSINGNYRTYQYDLIKKNIGNKILEVASS